ncbi:MAG TPA: hypothetical protein VGV61_13055 [Thermoanaerobaculia bacterium]|nr:hypothetical protein [Thermoanaerobaculia bacterium]
MRQASGRRWVLRLAAVGLALAPGAVRAGAATSPDLAVLARRCGRR